MKQNKKFSIVMLESKNCSCRNGTKFIKTRKDTEIIMINGAREFLSLMVLKILSANERFVNVRKILLMMSVLKTIVLVNASE